MRIWRLHEAKNRLSEVVDLTLKEGPQIATRRGKEAVVILAVDQYRRLTGQPPCLIDCLLNAPRGKPLLLERSQQANGLQGRHVHRRCQESQVRASGGLSLSRQRHGCLPWQDGAMPTNS
jgi:prevent-host-death family protein